MDRLEKALTKAREQRGAALADPAAAGGDGVVCDQGPGAILSRQNLSGQPAQPPTAAANGQALQTRQVAVGEAELERHRVVSRLRRNANADIFRMLRTKVLQAMARSNLRTLAVTSPNYGDGKTTVAVNLALSLALDVKQTVLLVDLDLRSPDIHKVLGIEPEVGLADCLLHDTPVPDCLVKPAFERIVVLPISQPMEGSSELLGTPKMAALAHELKTRYSDRIVIFDMPPLLTQDDAIAFLPHVDGVLLVVRDGVTQVDEVAQCMDALANANLLGTVLNDCA